jgi:hypothetical protein
MLALIGLNRTDLVHSRGITNLAAILVIQFHISGVFLGPEKHERTHSLNQRVTSVKPLGLTSSAL